MFGSDILAKVDNSGSYLILSEPPHNRRSQDEYFRACIVARR